MSFFVLWVGTCLYQEECKQVLITAEQLFGVELRSEADCEYPLDMRRLGKKEACT